MKGALIAGLLLAVPPMASSQTPRAGDDAGTRLPATFRASTDLVALNVTVTDARDQHLPGLTASDFVVLEEGVEQPVSFFAVSEVPLDLTLLVDASASMYGKIDIAREAVRGLARRLRPGDRAALVEFRDGVDHRQPMTGDLPSLERALGAIAPAGDTALYNAIYVALSQFRGGASGADAPVRRQAIVLLSDGQDTASLIGYEEVLEEARRRGVTVYAVAMRLPAEVAAVRMKSDGRALVEADYVMRALARETGGRSFFPTAVDELHAIYAGIATELGQQYAVGYVPRNDTRDGGWRRIQVRVPSHPGARLRTRSGYFAEPGPRGIAAAGRPASSTP